MKNVFISYNSKDRSVVSELVSTLKDSNIECWFDIDRINGGSDILRGINDALLECKSMVVCIGTHGIGRYQNFEVGAAFSLLAGKDGPSSIIPVLLPGTLPSALPPLLTSFSYIDLTISGAMSRLLRSLDKDVSIPGRSWKYRAFYWAIWHEPYRLFLMAIGMAIFASVMFLATFWVEFSHRLFPEKPSWVAIPQDEEAISGVSFSKVAKSETTVGQYEACVKANVCKKQELRTGCHSGDYFSSWPVNCVNWEDASKYCKWADARLPSENEWDLLSHAGILEKFPFPSGQERKYIHYLENGIGVLSANKVAQLEPNKWGLFDTYGNVWEWTQDSIKHDDTRKIIKGGSAENIISQIKEIHYDFKNYLGISPFIGFRCVR